MSNERVGVPPDGPLDFVPFPIDPSALTNPLQVVIQGPLPLPIDGGNPNAVLVTGTVTVAGVTSTVTIDISALNSLLFQTLNTIIDELKQTRALLEFVNGAKVEQ